MKTEKEIKEKLESFEEAKTFIDEGLGLSESDVSWQIRKILGWVLD